MRSSIYGKEKGDGALLMGRRRMRELSQWEEEGRGSRMVGDGGGAFILLDKLGFYRERTA